MTTLRLTFPQLTNLISEKVSLTNVSKQDFRELVRHMCDVDLITLFTRDIIITQDLFKQLICMVERLNAHEPLAYVIGECEFCGYSFNVDKRVLIPRPETEEMVMEIVKMYANHKYDNLKILDLCSGSGCIGISLKKKIPRACVTFVDVSKDALNLLNKNLKRFNLQGDVIHSDLFEGVNDTYNIIVSNPPYVALEDETMLSDSVKKYEPLLALYAADKGMKIIKDICSQASSYLVKNGVLFIEHGWQQSRAVVEYCEGLDFKKIKTHRDINMKDRFVILHI